MTNACHHIFTLPLTAYARPLLFLLLVLVNPSARAQCEGETEWQESVLVDRFRCGRPGFQTNSTYYSVEDDERTIWKTVPGLGVATSNRRSVVTYSSGASNRCQTDLIQCHASSTNSWDVIIPFDAVADLHANDGGPCDRSIALPGGCDCGGGQLDGGPPTDSCNQTSACGNICQTAFNQLLMLCCDGSLFFPPNVATQTVTASEMTDSSSIQEITTTYENGLGTQRDRRDTQLSDPYTLAEFGRDVLDEAEGSSWWDGRFFLNSLVPDSEKQCLGASRLRYRIKFPSRLGARHTARWSLMVIQYSPVLTTNVVSGFSWSAIGTGQTLYSPWFLLPRPGMFEISDGEVIDLEIESRSECADGNCAEREETPGDGPDQLGSAHLIVSLGAGTIDHSAGSISLHAESPGPELTTPESLLFNLNRAVVQVRTNLDRTIHLAAPILLARIEATNRHSFWIHCSARHPDGTYATNNPFISHLVINPGGDTNAHTLQHVRLRNGTSITNEFVCESASPTSNSWRLISGNGLKGERRSRVNRPDGTRLESYRIFTPGTGEELFRQDELYRSTALGDRLLSRIIDPEGAALTMTNSYDARGRLVLTMHTDGTWERLEYDEIGWLRRRVRPFADEPVSAPPAQCRVTSYDYSPVAGAPDLPTIRPGEPRTVVESARGLILSKRMNAHPDAFVTITQIGDNPGATWDAASVESTRREYDAEHRLTFSRHANGTSERILRQAEGTGRLTMTQTFDDSGRLFQKIEERVDALGRRQSRKVFDGATGLLLEQELHEDPDEFKRPTRVRFLDGTSITTLKADCCSPARVTEQDGVVTTHVRDALGRTIASTRLGLTTSNAFDAAGRLLAQFRLSPSGRPILQRAIAYDRAGRIIRETNPLGGVTSHVYERDLLGRRIRRTLQPDGGQRIEVRHLSGDLESITGSATHPTRYLHSVTNDHGRPRLSRTEIKLDRDGRDTPEWEQVLVDHAGRHGKTLFPGSPVPFRQSFRNAKGQLWKEQDPDGVVTLYGYNAMGQREFICLDADRNDVIDVGLNDRITRVIRDVASAHDTIVRRTQTFTWNAPGDPTPSLTETTETSVDGTKRWRTDVSGSTVTVRTKPADGAYTVTETAPDRRFELHLFRNGQLLITAQYDSNGVQQARTTFAYDSFGRLASQTDARNGTTTYQYNNADQTVRVTTPDPGIPGENLQHQVHHYDLMGRLTNSILADGRQIVRTYSARGDLLHMQGGGTHPVAMDYDAQGRLIRMTNWSDFERGAGERVTVWDYDPGRGWLRQKRHADGRGPSYDYTVAGRILQRRWARGITTTYAYNAFGENESVAYDDNLTPSVAYARDRSGQIISITQGTNTWQFSHTAAGQLAAETWLTSRVAGLQVTNSFDPLGRRVSTQVRRGGLALLEHRYSYDPAGRLSVASSGSSRARYSYIANSPLVGQIAFEHDGAPRMTTTRQHDLLDRLVSVSSQSQGTSAADIDYTSSSHQFTRNAASQITRTTSGDGSFWLYDYDDLGQLTAAHRHWSDHSPVAGQQFEYEFDSIGNRAATRAGGNADGSELRSARYLANALNQIVQREVPSAVDVLGAAHANADEVIVNGIAAHRHGEYFQATIPVDNTSGPVWQPITTQAKKNRDAITESGHIFQPPAAERFDYDADGNLIRDGRWSFVWDAENRLIAVEGHDSLPAEARLMLRFQYDPRGRRIGKTVSRWTGSMWGRPTREAYLYDGWNLIAVLDADRGEVTRSFLWGSDLSGTHQGAGGIGGLLAINAGGTTWFPGFDGNGNVVALFDAATGAVAARYEYGPFGELVRRSGPAAAANPFRFSTKFHDDETGLLYYGHRYYSSQVGRWLSRDPMEEQEGGNLYGFVRNNAISSVDPLGLQCLQWIHGQFSVEIVVKLVTGFHAGSETKIELRDIGAKIPLKIGLTDSVEWTQVAKVSGLQPEELSGSPPAGCTWVPESIVITKVTIGTQSPAGWFSEDLGLFRTKRGRWERTPVTVEWKRQLECPCPCVTNEPPEWDVSNWTWPIAIPNQQAPQP